MNPRLYQYSKVNRATSTPAESILRAKLTNWKALRVAWEYQSVVGDYILDFKCRQYPLVVELDGAHHRENEAQRLYDQRRDRFLKSCGFTVLRFSNVLVLDDCVFVLSRIKAELIRLGCPNVPISNSKRWNRNVV